MLKKTFAAVITTAALLSAGAAMAQPVDPNWAFSKELVEVLKNKNGYTVIKKIEAQTRLPASGKPKASRRSTAWNTKLFSIRPVR